MSPVAAWRFHVVLFFIAPPSRLPFLPSCWRRVAAALAVADGLTLEAAQRLALGQSRKLAAQDASISASRDMAVAAGQLPDPVLKVGIDNLPVNGPDRFSLTSDFMTMRRIGVMQEMPGADKRQLRAGRFEREADKASAEKALAAAAIGRDTALAWLDRYYAERDGAGGRRAGRRGAAGSERRRGRLRAGRGSQADMFAARGALAMVHDRASEIGRRVQNARIALARWVGAGAGHGAGRRARSRAHPARRRDARPPARAPPADRGARPQEDVAAAEARLAQANRKPDWSVEVAFQQRGSAYSNMMSVGVSVPLQWDRAKRQDRELAAKLALVEQARAEREDALRAHVAETQAMLAEWQNGRERQARYGSELMPLAARAHRGDAGRLPRRQGRAGRRAGRAPQ